MALQKRGKHHYGDSQADLREEILRYTKKNAYLAEHTGLAQRRSARPAIQRESC